MASIKILLDKCTGCTLCVKSCPFGAIHMAERKAVIDMGKCTLCGACAGACKFSAIELEKAGGPAKDLSAYKNVWVFCEQKKGVIQSISFELLGEGRQLADKLGVKLCAVLLGSGMEDAAERLGERGADKVYLVDHPALKAYQDEPYTAVLVKLVEEFKPEVILCGASTIGRSLISRVAIKTSAGLTADCTGLDIDVKERLLLQTRHRVQQSSTRLRCAQVAMQRRHPHGVAVQQTGGVLQPGAASQHPCRCRYGRRCPGLGSASFRLRRYPRRIGCDPLKLTRHRRRW